MAIQAKLLTGIVAVFSSALLGLGAHKLMEPKDVKETLIQKNKTILNTATEGDDASKDQQEWEKIIKKPEFESELKNFLGINESGVQLNTKLDDLKKKCEEQLNVEVKDNKFPDALKNSEKFCVKLEGQ